MSSNNLSFWASWFSRLCILVVIFLFSVFSPFICTFVCMFCSYRSSRDCNVHCGMIFAVVYFPPAVEFLKFRFVPFVSAGLPKVNGFVLVPLGSDWARWAYGGLTSAFALVDVTYPNGVLVWKGCTMGSLLFCWRRFRLFETRLALMCSSALFSS